MKIVAPRGPILDRGGRVLVENRPGLAVGIRPMDVPVGQLDVVIRRLAGVLDVPEKRIKDEAARIDGPDDRAARLARGAGRVRPRRGRGGRDAPGRVAPSWSATPSYPGVEVRKDYLRSYPMGELAAQVLGHLGEISREQLKERRYRDYRSGDVIGQGGLEATYDRWLRGRDGLARVEVDAMGRPKSHEPVAGGRMKEPGDTLVLTLDSRVQAKTEQALRYGIDLAHQTKNWRANGAAAVVMDVRNGEIIALASYPTFDPDIWANGLTPKEWKRARRPRREPAARATGPSRASTPPGRRSRRSTRSRLSKRA